MSEAASRLNKLYKKRYGVEPFYVHMPLDEYWKLIDDLTVPMIEELDLALSRLAETNPERN